MNWQDIVVLIIVLAAIVFFVIRMARSFRHVGSCPSCPHGKDIHTKNDGNTNCHVADTCAGCPLHDTCHKS